MEYGKSLTAEREAHDATKAELAALKSSLAAKNAAEMRDLLEEMGRVKLERDALRKHLKREYVVQSQCDAPDLAAVKDSLAWWKTRYKNMTDQYFEEAVKVLNLNTALGVAEESLATAERDRERWMAVHDREWDVEVYPSGECSIFDPKEKSGIYHIVDSAPTLEAALDAAFALYPLEAK